MADTTSSDLSPKEAYIRDCNEASELGVSIRYLTDKKFGEEEAYRRTRDAEEQQNRVKSEKSGKYRVILLQLGDLQLEEEMERDGTVQIQIDGEPYETSIREYLRFYKEIIGNIVQKFFAGTTSSYDEYESTNRLLEVIKKISDKKTSRGYNSTGQIIFNRLAEGERYPVNGDESSLTMQTIKLVATSFPGGIEDGYDLIPDTIVEQNVLRKNKFWCGDMSGVVDPCGRILIDEKPVSLNDFEEIGEIVKGLWYGDNNNGNATGNHGSEVPVSAIIPFLEGVKKISLPHIRKTFELADSKLVTGELGKISVIGIRSVA
ncbi:MAG: hypothetical protein U9Q92_00470 [archaeon]|nr:hypothetical protein [archaeon]